MTLKNGTLILNGEKLKTPDAIIGAIGEDLYTQTYRKAATMRTSGVVLISVGEARLKKAADGYNKRNNIAYLSVTPGGLALRF